MKHSVKSFYVNKTSCEIFNKLKSRGFRASSLSTNDFSTSFTIMPHNLSKAKLVNLFEKIVSKGRLFLYYM